MLGKRLLCLHSNIDRLSKQGRCYLWTFTFAEAVDYLALRASWNRLLTYLRRKLPSWAGIRVYEVHPGKWGEFSHGLHVHVICNRYQDVNLVRSVAQSAGWGRVHVTRVRPGREYYVTKYLSKLRPDALKGWRLFSSFGPGLRTRIADILVESVRADLMRYAAAMMPRASWYDKLDRVNRWSWCYLAGLWNSSVAVALSGKWRFSSLGSRRHWTAQHQIFSSRDLSGWGFHQRQSVKMPPQFDPFASCWGPDVLRRDLLANRAHLAAIKLGQNTIAIAG